MIPTLQLGGLPGTPCDEVVFVTFQDDGMSLTLQGRAIADASVGEPVQVMNTTSKKIIEAVASGPGHAVVGPQAETLRSTGTAPFRTASNREMSC